MRLELGNLLVNSALLMLFQKAILSVVVPILKKIGDDDHKLWAVGVPSYILALELGQCVLILSSEVDGEFYPILIMQELNSVVKNMGHYNDLYCFIHRMIGRPISPSNLTDLLG